MALPFAKDPIAGIRPIEEMFNVDRMAATRPSARLLSPVGAVADLLPARTPAGFGDTRMVEVGTLISLSGFTPA